MSKSIPSAGNPPLLEVRDLQVHFEVGGNGLFSRSRPLRAVDGVSLSLRQGETLGLVGESGCGKSTMARAIMQLVPLAGGGIFWEGKPLAELNARDPASQPGRLQMIFQDPYASLNPRMTVESTLSEPLLVHGLATGPEVLRRVRRLLDQVGLPEQALRKYPHEFSGGQRQRIVIARALTLEPRVLLADEPVSALDVSIQAQILNLLASLRRELGLGLIFIGHDLSVVRHVSDRIAVMYLGRLVETGPAELVMDAPAHPYTRALISSAPRLARSTAQAVPLEGELPSPLNPPSGCPFHPRCIHAKEECRSCTPPLLPYAEGRAVACLRPEIFTAETTTPELRGSSQS